MGYEYLDHTTDLIVRVEAKTMNEALEYAAESVADTTFDLSTVSETQTRTLCAQGNSMRIALLDWLEAVNYLLITDGFAAHRFEAHIEGSSSYTIRGTAHGETLDIARHKFKIEVKAPTLHMMEISESQDRVTLQFLLDL